MNTKTLRLICCLALIFPVIATAQKNVQSAFDAILKCKDAEISRNLTLDKDPETNVKTGQCNAYHFELPANKINLVNDVVSALDKDSDKAYSIEQGSTKSRRKEVFLAVGDGSSSGFQISKPGYKYIYALFMAPKTEDPDGKYRYAYGINYRKDGDKIKGTLVITYATTLKYRQQREREVFKNYSGSGIKIYTSQKSWFEELMSYLQAMSTENSQTRISLATKAYTLIQNVSKYPDATEQDKDTAREVLKAMISDRKYSDPVLNRLLTQSLASLK